MVTHTHLQARLEARLAEIQGRVGRIEQDLRKTPDPDWSEQAAAAENDEVLEGLDDLARAEVAEIRQALQRMAAGQYGFCTACREPIDEKRLAAVPTADRCIYCAG
jgi:DnaK suppressor protein